jgi:hypothetical protein
MADYVEVGIAVAKARGEDPQHFLSRYEAKIAKTTAAGHDDPHVFWIEELLSLATEKAGGVWQGYARDLAVLANEKKVYAPGKDGDQVLPAVVGKSLARAERTLRRSGWSLREIEDDPSATHAKVALWYAKRPDKGVRY